LLKARRRKPVERKKKLIEAALPLEAINAESAREKSIRYGHPSTLHLWWARRPLAAARAVIWSSLVDDPSARPEEFPTEEAQAKERKRLFRLLEKLVKWENSSNESVIEEAKAEILKSTGGNPPALLDPFSGGGTIPFEAQRLGLEAHACDLNPVAVMINKAMIEMPQRFSGQHPVHPEAKRQEGFPGASGLAEDVRRYGEWMQTQAFKRVGHMYPKAKDELGQERTVMAWIWARTVKCPNPACEREMPLVKSFQLSKKKGFLAHVSPMAERGGVRYILKEGASALAGTVERSGARCVFCGAPVGFAYIRSAGQAGLMGERLIAIAAEGASGRVFIAPCGLQEEAALVPKPEAYPSGPLSGKAKQNVGLYGFKETGDLFTNRQLTALATLSGLIKEAGEKVRADGGSEEYAKALCAYLAFAVNKLADNNSSIVSWNINRDGLRNTFSRQAIPMSWDYAEANPFSSSAGCFANCIDWIARFLDSAGGGKQGVARQLDAQSDSGLRDAIVSTDPPYYNNIAYADLSDFFYVWLRHSLKKLFPDIFQTMLAPKAEELVATPYRFGGSADRARAFFEEGMLMAFSRIYECSRADFPVTVYYAFKQSDDDSDSNTSSTGWETMLSAIIHAGFSITGTWPMRTERASRTVGKDSNALASSIILVCRKRDADAPICARRDFIGALKRELKPALQKLEDSNIAPVDLAQCAIGPGMGEYSRHSVVLEADGTPMGVRSALQIINKELDLFFSEQDGELDRDSRFCVELYTQRAFGEVGFGEADVLARAKNTSIERLRAAGVLHAEKGTVRLLSRHEVGKAADSKPKSKPDDGIDWLLAQRLAYALEKDGISGVARIVAYIFTSEPESAKALAYRLYTIAERKGWANDAFAYNSLVIAWPDVKSKAAEYQAARKNARQINMFGDEELE
jgi:putative DNA methylase